MKKILGLSVVLLLFGVLFVHALTVKEQEANCADIIKVLFDDPSFDAYQSIVDEYVACRQNITEPTSYTTTYTNFEELGVVLSNYSGTKYHLRDDLKDSCSNATHSIPYVSSTTFSSDVGGDLLKFRCGYIRNGTKYDTWWNVGYNIFYQDGCYYRFSTKDFSCYKRNVTKLFEPTTAFSFSYIHIP